MSKRPEDDIEIDDVNENKKGLSDTIKESFRSLAKRCRRIFKRRQVMLHGDFLVFVDPMGITRRIRTSRIDSIDISSDKTSVSLDFAGQFYEFDGEHAKQIIKLIPRISRQGFFSRHGGKFKLMAVLFVVWLLWPTSDGMKLAANDITNSLGNLDIPMNVPAGTADSADSGVLDSVLGDGEGGGGREWKPKLTIPEIKPEPLECAK